MSRDLDISLLRAFSAVVETGSVTAAARLLNRTQAAVSLQIKRLEDTVDQQLFDRGHRRLTLTPGGERLLAQAQRIVSLNDDLFAQMTTPEFEGEIRFGVPTDIVQTYMPPILRRFSKAWPRVRLSPSLGNSFFLLEQFRNGNLDLSLTTDTRVGAGGETMRVDRLVWVCAPGSAAHRETPLPLAVGDSSCRFRPSVIDALRQAGLDWRFVLEVSNQVAQDATVSAGIAVGASLRDSIPDFLDELGSESNLPPLPEYQINLYAPKSGLNPLADELARHIRQEFTVRFGGLGHGLPTKPVRPPRAKSSNGSSASG